jgi:sigma-B regulation protein RsbU (phosphoserine phosphatase)
VHGARLPLGVRRDVRYDAVEVQLERGDRLVLFSDGIPEAPARGGEQLGYDAFRDTLATGGGIDAMLERVRAQVTDIDDDWTVVVLERT